MSFCRVLTDSGLWVRLEKGFAVWPFWLRNGEPIKKNARADAAARKILVNIPCFLFMKFSYGSKL